MDQEPRLSFEGEEVLQWLHGAEPLALDEAEDIIDALRELRDEGLLALTVKGEERARRMR